MPLLLPLLVAALLFAIGLYGVLARRNAILVLMAVELMLNAVNLNLVAFDVYLRDELLSGQVFTLFVITIAAAEVGLGLAIVLLVFRNRATTSLDELDELREDTSRADAPIDTAADTPADPPGTVLPAEVPGR
jgi:NADH-quinone oxidoreductase subunit K